MNLKNTFRKMTPELLWQTLGFIKRSPGYWLMDRSDSLRLKHNQREGYFYVRDDLCVHAPENITAHICWRAHGFEDTSSRHETQDFLQLSEGCSGLIDIGGQTGFMSALFAQSRAGDYRILSVEPDPLILPILKRAKELNQTTRGQWDIAEMAVSDVDGLISFLVSNPIFDLPVNARQDESREVKAIKLSTLLDSLSWTPDIVKVDVESFEHEILAASMDSIAKIKPKLQLEVHWEILERRGKSARGFLGPLYDLGYRGLRRKLHDLAAWERDGRSNIVTRLSLSV